MSVLEPVAYLKWRLISLLVIVQVEKETAENKRKKSGTAVSEFGRYYEGGPKRILIAF
jgi:hypothetical protein